MHVIRAFVRLREVLALHRDLATKLDELERKVGVHDQEIQAVFDAVRRLMKEPEKPKRRIGFTAEEKKCGICNYKVMNSPMALMPDVPA